MAEKKPPGWRWQDTAAGGGLMDELHPVRRVVAAHEIRFDGFSDLLLRAHGASVFDVGCNRGHVLWDFAMNGAAQVHGCDIDGPSMVCARMWFSEHPNVQSKFEVVDLRKGAAAVQAAFGEARYDIVLLLGVQHKLKREMEEKALLNLMVHLGQRALTYFGWTGYPGEDAAQTARALTAAGLHCVHTSEMAGNGRPAMIWRRDK